MNSNFQIKVTLQEANDIKEALEDKRAALMGARRSWEDRPELGHQAGRIETILKRDFS